MFKITMLVKKKAELSQQEFLAHWAAHSAKVLQHQNVLHIRRYAKTLPLDADSQQATQRHTQAFHFDAMGELWYDSREDFAAARTTPEGAADVSLFTEHSDLQKALSDAMDRWAEATEALDAEKGAS